MNAKSNSCDLGVECGKKVLDNQFNGQTTKSCKLSHQKKLLSKCVNGLTNEVS